MKEERETETTKNTITERKTNVSRHAVDRELGYQNHINQVLEVINK